MEQIDMDIRLLEWWKALRDTNNETFLPLFFDESRYLVLCGGGGSGKSIFAGRKVLERVTTEPGHRWLVCRKVGRTLRDSCFAQLRGQIGEFYPNFGAKSNKTDMKISFPNGNEILFAGLDDVEKLKSIYNVTGIWIEEASELEERDFNQLDIRLRTSFPYYLQMILSFNPISTTHWLKKRFFDSADPRATTHRSAYRDNRFLPPEAVKTLEAFRDTDPYYYQVYCLGEWGVTGRTIFNAAVISERLRELKEPIREGFYEYELGGKNGLTPVNIRWVEESGGAIRIYREAEDGTPYVIGGDTAGDGSDWFVGQVLNNTTGEQAAVLRHRYDEDTYARQMYCLGMEYGGALIGIETNFSTYPVKLLDMMGYPRQFVREREDSFTGAVMNSYGFKTTAVTRPVIIGDLVREMREGLRLLNDRVTLEEMQTFVRNEKLRAEAAQGAHDDCVMALAIAWYIREQQETRRSEQTKQPERAWTKDMKEDYYRADAETRRYLETKWGKPE